MDEPGTEAEPDELTPVQKLERAIQIYLNEVSDEAPVLLDTCIVVWEQVNYAADGDIMRQVNYTVPTDRASFGAAVGLLDIGITLVKRDFID